MLFMEHLMKKKLLAGVWKKPIMLTIGLKWKEIGLMIKLSSLLENVLDKGSNPLFVLYIFLLLIN